MRNRINYWLLIVLGFIFVVFLQGCNGSSSRNSDYAPFPVDGWGVKYFDTKDRAIESKKWAYYYRKAFYKNGKPVKDSLATDYYMTGEKKTEGHLLSENPDTYDGERIVYYKGRVSEKQSFKNGVPVGERYYYLEDGSLFSITQYKNGIEDRFTQFDRDGKKNREGIYKDGFFYQDIYYYPNGRIEHISTYEDSSRESFISEGYYESGRIKFKGRFVKAPDFATTHKYKTVGDVYNYDEKGHLTIMNYDTKPVQPTKRTTNTYSNKKSSTWDRGYSYGWDVGYQDGVDGNDMWGSFNDAGKGGDFLDGYTSGYEDGYSAGRADWKRNQGIDDDD